MDKKKEKLNKVTVQNLFDTKKKPTKKSSLKMIDLFAGIGGIRLGLESIGGESVFTSEWDKSAQKTYQENFKELPYGDITQIDPQDIPEFDILLAGFPCQPFSQAGKKLGLADTRGTLFFDIAKILDYHRPTVVFLENVKRFRSHDEGRTFETIKNILEELGYEIYAEVLNAKDFGVPQNRERIYIIGFLGKTKFSFPKPLGIETRLGDILEKKLIRNIQSQINSGRDINAEKFNTEKKEMVLDTHYLMKIQNILVLFQHVTIKMGRKYLLNKKEKILVN